jgi:type IV pilus assembly protein PilZ
LTSDRGTRGKDRRRRTLPVPDGEDRRSERDRREHERVLVEIEVDYKCDDTFLFAYITDLSAMGIFIRTSMPHPPGTRLNLHFSPAGGTPVDVEGEVVWTNPHRPGRADNLNPGMGVQFVDLTAAQRDQVMTLVRTFAYLSDDDGEPMGNS